MQSKSSQWLDNSSKSLLLVLLAKERAERTQTEDFDAEEGELLEEENEQEEVFEHGANTQIHRPNDLHMPTYHTTSIDQMTYIY